MLPGDDQARRSRQEAMERFLCNEGTYSARTIVACLNESSAGELARWFREAQPWAGFTERQAINAVLDSAATAFDTMRLEK